MIQENVKIAQSRQKSYADKRRDLSFEVGDFVYLKVSPMRGTQRFKVKGMLALRYVKRSSSSTAREKSPINSNYHHRCQTYTMYFMFHSSRSAYEI
jgi:hypothetical protein